MPILEFCGAKFQAAEFLQDISNVIKFYYLACTNTTQNMAISFSWNLSCEFLIKFIRINKNKSRKMIKYYFE